MPRLLRARDNRNQPLVQLRYGALELSYFNLLHLRAGESHTLEVPGCELLCVVLSGQAEVAAGGTSFERVGRRANIWDGPADSVYCGTSARVTVRSLRDGTEVAVAGAACTQPFAPFRI
eukprot:gene50189-67209_t